MSDYLEDRKKLKGQAQPSAKKTVTANGYALLSIGMALVSGPLLLVILDFIEALQIQLLIYISPCLLGILIYYFVFQFACALTDSSLLAKVCTGIFMFLFVTVIAVVSCAATTFWLCFTKPMHI